MQNKGIWCSLLEWTVNGKSICVPVMADIQTTNILMDKIIIEIGEPLYLNIPKTLGVTLKNCSLLPTSVKWQNPIGRFKNNVNVTVVPSETVVEATSSCQFSIHVEPKMMVNYCTLYATIFVIFIAFKHIHVLYTYGHVDVSINWKKLSFDNAHY